MSNNNNSTASTGANGPDAARSVPATRARTAAEAEADRQATLEQARLAAAAAAQIAAAAEADARRQADGHPSDEEEEEQAVAAAAVAALRAGRERRAAAVAASAAAAPPQAALAAANEAHVVNAPVAGPAVYAGRLVFAPSVVAAARRAAQEATLGMPETTRADVARIVPAPTAFGGVSTGDAHALETWLESLHRWMVGTFLYARLTDATLVQVAIGQLTGAAAQWWSTAGAALGGSGVSITAFEIALRQRFQPRGSEESAFETLLGTKQTGDLQAYIALFQQRAAAVPTGMTTEAVLVHYFTAGLRPALQMEVRRAQLTSAVTTLQDAITRSVFAASLLRATDPASHSHTASAAVRGAASESRGASVAALSALEATNDCGYSTGGDAATGSSSLASTVRDIVQSTLTAMQAGRGGWSGGPGEYNGGSRGGRSWGSPGGAAPSRGRGGGRDRTRVGAGVGAGRMEGKHRGPPDCPEGACWRCYQLGHTQTACEAPQPCARAKAWSAEMKRIRDERQAEREANGDTQVGK